MLWSHSWFAKQAFDAFGDVLTQIYQFLAVLGKDVCIMTAIYVQLDCQIYFLGSSFLGSGFGVGNLNVSGFLSTPGPTCYTELVSMAIYFLQTRYIPPTLQCHLRSFERPALTLTVLRQCASFPRHIEFRCNLSMGNPSGVDGHQSRSRSWYVVNQDARWRRHRKDHTPLVHTSLLHRTG